MLSRVLIIGLEFSLVLIAVTSVFWITSLLMSRVGVSRKARAMGKLKMVLIVAAFLLLALIVAFNAWLIATGRDVRSYTLGALTSISAETKSGIAIASGKLLIGILLLLVTTRLLRRFLAWAQRAVDRWDQISTNDRSLASLFAGLDRLIVITGWLLLGVLAFGWFGLPAGATDALLLGIRIFLVISIGVMVIRCTAFTVDTLDGLSKRSAEKRGWLAYYDHIQPLLPTFRTCLEYALWILIASLVLAQFGTFREFAWWGPRLIQAIAIFFAGRVFMELGTLEIGRRMLPAEGLADADRRRRMTTFPLVRTGFKYASYFGTGVLILGTLGFNPMPFLAGAGIVGLVIGFGAQSMIDDAVSGFFILFENIYLVGDTIEVPPSTKGVVEAIDFRTTKIRDADGRVHILRNGSIKPVINYSKNYTRAVVNMEVSYGADLRNVFITLQEAGQRLRAENDDVISDTEIDGIIAFGPTSMTVRTSTRVKPGRHGAVEAAHRLLIKELFDDQSEGKPRRSLIPQPHRDHEPTPATGRMY